MNLEKTDIRQVLSGIYSSAALDESCDMRELAVVLEGLAEVYGEYPTLQAWKKVKIDRERFEKEAYFSRILEFREQVNKKFLDKAVEEIRQRTASDKDSGFDLWFDVYTHALEYWEGDIFGGLCEHGFDFKAIDLEKINQFKLLNLLVLDEKWPEAYQWFLDFAENENLPDSRRSNFYLYSAQVILYYFGYPDQVKALIDSAERVFLENLLIKRVRAESLIVSRDLEQARSLLLNAINADPNHIENYHYLGDSYLHEEKFEAAEQWYNDALQINFMDPLTYSKLINLRGASGTSEIDLPVIESLFENAVRFLEEGKFKNYLYILQRELGSAFHKAGNLEKSIQSYLRSIELKPNLSSAKIELAYVFVNHSRFEEGEKWFMAAIDHQEPKINFAAYWGLGWLYECAQLNDPRKAIEYYSQCIGLRIIGDDRVYNVIGNLYFSLKEFERSVELFRKAIEEYPLEIVYHNNLKDALDNVGNPELLVDYYEDLVNHFPTESLYFNEAGVFHYGQGNLEKAIMFYSRAIEINSNIPVYWENRGLAYEKLKAYEPAISDYLRSLEMKEDAGVYNTVGILQYWQGRNEEAVQSYARAIGLEENIAIYWENRSLAYEELNDYPHAEQDIRKALQIEATARRHNLLGVCLNKQGRNEEALTSYTRALELDDKDPVMWKNRAISYEALGKLDEAIADYSTAGKLKEDPLISNSLGRLHYWKGNFESAIENYTKAIALDSSVAVFYENRGLAYQSLDKLDLAERDYLNALSITENKNSYNSLGIIKMKQGNFVEAIGYFSKAIDLSPDECVLWENRALTYEYLDRNEEACADYQKALELHESPVSHNGIGKIKYLDADFEAAYQHFLKATELDPANEIYRENFEMVSQNMGLNRIG